jgi:hypothetical protein
MAALFFAMVNHPFTMRQGSTVGYSVWGVKASFGLIVQNIRETQLLNV